MNHAKIKNIYSLYIVIDYSKQQSVTYLFWRQGVRQSDISICVLKRLRNLTFHKDRQLIESLQEKLKEQILLPLI